MRTPALLLSLLLAAPVAAQTPKPSGGVLIPEQAAFDVLHYDLRLHITPRNRTIDGKVTMTATALSNLTEIVLDLDEHLSIGRVGQFEVPLDAPYAKNRIPEGELPLNVKHQDGRLFIRLAQPVAADQRFAISLKYGGTPREAPNPPWNGGFTWERTTSGKPWIATSCQGEGADLWWPCKDHPSDEPDSMDLHITVPEDLVVAANGVLAEVEESKNVRTYHWQVRSPINNYAVALNIAPYEVLESTHTSVTGEEFPVVFYVLPSNVEKAKKLMKEAKRQLAHFESVLGPYPFRHEKFGVAETPHLGMEHQTITAYGNQYRQARDGYDWLLHHEVAHEWWANLVTCSDWKDMWIHEGFGTYMQPLYLEHIRGKAGLVAEIRKQRAQLSNKRAVAPRATHDSKQIYFAPDGSHDNDIYNKGSLVLHTLRWHLGDETFFKLLRRFAYPTKALEAVTDGSQTRLVDTNDFIEMAEAVSGQELDWFFDVYLRQPKLPRLEVKRSGSKLALAWQVPGGGEFPLAVPVSMNGKTYRIEMPGGVNEIGLGTGGTPDIDPELWLLKASR